MSERGEPAPARPAKSAAAFRTIGEVADDLDLPAHVLRFWESKFPQLKPLKRGGGRRYYRPEDIVLLRRIRQCLYHDGYTIRGVQKLLGGPVLADRSLTEAAARRQPPDDRGPMPTLFPLDASEAAPPSPGEPDPPGGASEPPAPPPPGRPPRRPRRATAAAALSPEQRAALEDLRRELTEIRSLLGELLPKSA